MFRFCPFLSDLGVARNSEKFKWLEQKMGLPPARVKNMSSVMLLNRAGGCHGFFAGMLL
jgi:hypothetical protein